MRVVILVDARFAIHERALIERVIVGLADEGIVAQVVLPKDRELEEYGFDLLSEPIWYADRGLTLTQRIRAHQVARQLVNKDASKETETLTGVIDVVHVFGGGAWSMGKELARILDAGIIFEVWRSGLIDSIKGLHLTDDDRVKFLIPERAFEYRLTQLDRGYQSHLAQWGAPITPEPSQIFRPEKMTSVMLMSSGRQKDQCIAAFEGIADAIEDNENTMVFANLEVVERADLWSRVESRKIQDRFTIIDRSEDRRDLLLRCDLMVYPDTLHEERTLLLDAMGTGMAIIAGNDEQIQPIQDSDGIVIVDRPTRKAWAAKVSEYLANPQRARADGLASREYVTKNRRVSMYITSVLDAYAALSANEQPAETK